MRRSKRRISASTDNSRREAEASLLFLRSHCRCRGTPEAAGRRRGPQEERAAFDAAVAMQAEYEADPQVQRRMQARGISEFAVNGFSASLKGAHELFPGGLSPDARAVLFGAGLLYRGARLC